MPLPVEPIGTVRSPVVEGRDHGWGEVVSELELREDLAPGLEGIEAFSHVIVVFWMHQSSFDLARDLVRRPQGRPDMPEIGIFAQRAKHRPNPIGTTTVKLIAREGRLLRVQGLDAIDGTPILDVKPCYPQYDLPERPRVPEWVARLMRDYFS